MTLQAIASDRGSGTRVPDIGARHDILDVGDVLDGRYQLLRDLGRGAAGAVYEARHLFTGRFVAVKILLPQVRRRELDEMRERLQREARMLASIRHPGVVEVLDGGLSETGVPYIVLEMLEGRTLEGLVTLRTKLTPAAVVGVTLQLCDALGAVHRAGVLHRDIKPSNVIVQRDASGRERVKLLDFGIAKMRDADRDARLTGAGEILGTPAYMAPERLLTEDEGGVSSDIYSLGVTMFECLSGTMPITGNYPRIMAHTVRGAPLPSLRAVAPDVPEALAQIVDRAIARDPSSRFSSAREMAAALERSFPGAARETTLLGPDPRTKATAGAATAQRRRSPRAPYNTPVRLMLAHGVLDGRCEDISEGGLLVLSEATCAPGQRVALRFALPMEGKVASVEADVRWIRAARGIDAQGMRAIGLEFVDLPAAVRASVSRYVELMSSGNVGS
jgi:eukaryotic-like serine/threonine-protein kinase